MNNQQAINELTPEQKQELMRRLTEHDANPESAISLKELQRQLNECD
ncbi:MAG: addiction module protein [Pirellulaceae bacterium]